MNIMQQFNIITTNLSNCFKHFGNRFQVSIFIHILIAFITISGFLKIRLLS